MDAVSVSTHGNGSGLIWLDDVKCLGTESSLTDCQHQTWGDNDCGHSEDVGIDCGRLYPIIGPFS